MDDFDDDRRDEYARGVLAELHRHSQEILQSLAILTERTLAQDNSSAVWLTAIVSVCTFFLVLAHFLASK